MPRVYLFPRSLILAALFGLGVGSVAPARSSEPKWIRVSSAHFSVLTDAGEKKGREAALRLEQMRDIFAQLFLKSKLKLPEPLDVIALRSDEEYIAVAPLRQGRPISAPGFFLPGEDRNYIVLDMEADDGWRAVSHDFARMLLSFNYPATPDWFDEGFAQYFSSLRLGDAQAEIGGDPLQNLPWEGSLPGQSSTDPSPAKSFVELLNRPWLAIPDLFTMHPGPSGYPPMFYAQSWIVMHYLLNKNQLSEAGTYFGLVQIQKVPVQQAIQQAFGVAATQFEQAVKDYFHAFASPPQTQENNKTASSGGQIHQFPAPLAAADVGSSVQDVTDAQAQALVAEMSIRLPEHRDQAEQNLQTVINDPKAENAIAHRALAWAQMEANDFGQAGEELARARELDDRDPWVHYYLALVKFRAAQSSGKPIAGVSNMIQDLTAVVDWSPDFAEAHNMLAMARLQGGGVHAATDSIRVAIQLSPRSEQYLLNLAEIDLAGKKWDDATTLLERLKGSPDPQIAQTAQKHLADLPTLKKYGVLPQESASSAPDTGSTTQAKTVPQTADEKSGEDSDSSHADTAPAEPVPDRRKVQFARGKLLSVDCSRVPVAILTVRTTARTLRLRTENYKSLLLVGAEEFSCEWTNRAVVVNYKAGGTADGDLVSVEVQ